MSAAMLLMDDDIDDRCDACGSKMDKDTRYDIISKDTRPILYCQSCKKWVWYNGDK